MKINISGEFSDRISEIFGQLPGLIAELAGQYFRETFTRKAFDGNPWPQNKDPRRRGSELVKSSALRGSMSVMKLPDKVVVSFGNDKVDYAQVHNEGFDGEVVVPVHIRRTRRGEQQVRAHTRHMRIPQRQFLGEADVCRADRIGAHGAGRGADRRVDTAKCRIGRAEDAACRRRCTCRTRVKKKNPTRSFRRIFRFGCTQVPYSRVAIRFGSSPAP